MRTRHNLSRLLTVAGLILVTCSAIPATPSWAQNAPTIITSVAGLQSIANNPSGSYILGNDIVVTSKDSPFVPIGNFALPFSGSLNGNGFTISGLSINAPASCDSQNVCVGLFGAIAASGSVINVRLIQLNITVNVSQSAFIGGIAGSSAGQINNCSVQGVIHATGTAVAAGLLNIGGIAGQGGTIAFSDSEVSVYASDPYSTFGLDAGGLVGVGYSAISQSRALGSVTVPSGESAAVGGLVGVYSSNAAISYSIATGQVVYGGQLPARGVGGLVGVFGGGSVEQSYATGAIQGGSGTEVGGLIGSAEYALAGLTSGTISQTYAAGSVQGGANSGVGGLLGVLGSWATIDQSYSIGRVTTGTSGVVGGLIAQNSGTITVTNSYWNTQTSGTKKSAGGIGRNTTQFTNGTFSALGGFQTTAWEPMNLKTSFPISGGYYPQLWALSFPLTNFPLACCSPYAQPGPGAPIVTVFDHSMRNSPSSADGSGQPYHCDDIVEAFTGAIGQKKFGQDSGSCLYPGYKNAAKQNFVLNGVNYTGTTTYGPGYLEYDGHPGIDFNTNSMAPVFAAVSGTIFYPWNAIGSGPNYGTYCVFHAMAEIPDSAPSYRIYYLHLSTHPATFGIAPCANSGTSGSTGSISNNTQPCTYTLNGTSENSPSLPLPEGTHVQAGCEVALSGSAGVSSAHLHFEIQRIVQADALTGVATQISRLACFDESATLMYKQGKAGKDPYCLPADPYGWIGGATNCPPNTPANWSGDIWQCITGISSRRFWTQ